MENTLTPFSYGNHSDDKAQDTRKFYQFYVGIDIGASFHVASCIKFDAFLDPKGIAWKRTKTMKFNSDSAGIAEFLKALKQIEDQFNITRDDFLILLEPTGGHYSYLVQQVLLNEKYQLFQVENKAVGEFRKNNLGISEKSDSMDAKVMSYMGWHKQLHPHMQGVTLIKPQTVLQSLFRTVMRDRWYLNVQLTRRKNQVQQLLKVTHPDLNKAFKKLGTSSVMKLVLEYPTGLHMKQSSEDELHKAISKAGAKNVAKKAAKVLSEIMPYTVAVPVEHLVGRQRWVIEEALRLEESIKLIDMEIHNLLWGDSEKGIDPHPYTDLLLSFPFVSENIACTLIGVIGDVDRFNTYKEFKKYLGVSAENSQSGTSVRSTKQTYSGVRDARRVLYQMSMMMLANGKRKPTVFKAYYDRKVEEGMIKKKAIGHLCGKIANLIYTILKSGQKYDPKIHAAACGIEWDEVYKLEEKQESVLLN
ncbi:IS110 family transposase [Bacillus cereus]|uniref:IS110 family transposase n=1 Tax=Bacillus cereus TaxID=1396 RepID=UPI000BEC15DB|nr:transposase [Bacillus cereus]PEE35865.1 IS110 family transposase [Bacillus cereus]PET44231.1 IS110 family transposase [Bacillus cereus]PEV74423.1 IS110 family transposase [Bacillus cereus]PFA39512.1 IS110 family transposase [Bacillus cereus]PFD65376.1 IS110 family transposase [Bacillus cereus]